MTHSLGQGRKGEGPVHSWGERGGHGEGRYQIHPWLADSSEQEACSPEHVTAARSNDPAVTTAPRRERKHPPLSEKGEKQTEARQH